MYDVVPPFTPARPQSTPFRRSPRRAALSQPKQIPKNQTSGPRVVALQWQLPARLRRPIRTELARARRESARQKAIVNFERRSLYSEVPTTHPNYGRPQSQAVNTGAEHHTGDVYAQSRPNVVVGQPPYRPSVAHPAATRPAAINPIPMMKPRVRQLRSQSQPKPVGPRPATLMPAGLGNDVRDVPYQWAPQAQAPVSSPTVFMNDAQKLLAPIQQPKRRFALPLHLSVFPWRKKQVAASLDTGKKKL